MKEKRQPILPPPKRPPRIRNVSHWWVDKRVDRFLRQNLEKRDYRNWRDVYTALCAIESDNFKTGTPTRLPLSLYKDIARYAGMNKNTVSRILQSLRSVGLVDYGQVRRGGKETWFVLFEFDEYTDYRKLLERVARTYKLKLRKLLKNTMPSIEKATDILIAAYCRYVLNSPNRQMRFDKKELRQFRTGAEKISQLIVDGDFNRMQPYSLVEEENDYDKYRRCTVLFMTFLNSTFGKRDPIQTGNVASLKNWKQFLAWMKQQHL